MLIKEKWVFSLAFSQRRYKPRPKQNRRPAEAETTVLGRRGRSWSVRSLCYLLLVASSISFIRLTKVAGSLSEPPSASMA